MILRFSCVLMVMLILAGYTPARAEDNLPALRSTLEKIIADIERKHTQQQSPIFNGDIKIESAGNYYSVALPHAQIPHGDGKLDIGMVALNIAPHTQPGQWKASMALPTPMIWTDSQGQDTVRIDLGPQRAAGVLDAQFGGFLKFDSTLSDLTLSSPGTDNFSGQIAKIHTLYDLNITPEGRVSGPYGFSISGVSVDTKSGPNVRLGQADMNIKLENFHKRMAEELQKAAGALFQNTPSAPDAPQGQKMPSLIGLLKLWFDVLGDGFTLDYSLKDLSIQRPANESGKIESINIDSMTIGTNWNRVDSNLFNIGFRIGMDMGDNQTPPDFYDDTFPEAVYGDIELQRLPLVRILEISGPALEPQSQQAAESAGLMMLVQIPALLSENKSRLVFKKSEIRSKDYAVLVDGFLEADLSVGHGFIGTLNFAIHGYDALKKAIIAAQEKAGDASPVPLKGIADFVDPYLPYAALSKDEAGHSVQTFSIEFTREGKTMVNGKEFVAADTGATSP